MSVKKSSQWWLILWQNIIGKFNFKIYVKCPKTLEVCVALKPVYTFSIDGAFWDVEADNSIGTNAIPYHQRHAFELSPDDVPFLFISENKTSIIIKNNNN